MYKLACTFENPEIREIAKETVHFVKLKGDDETGYKIREMAAPFWEDERFQTAIEKRAETKGDKPPVRYLKRHDWKTQLKNKVEGYDALKREEMTKARPPLLSRIMEYLIPG